VIRREIDDTEVEEILINIPSDIDTPHEHISCEISTDENIQEQSVASTASARDVSSESEDDTSHQQNL
jgi:hypothetical protein